ncbi:transposase [Streptomyces diastatochromogenes]|uniref:transposase n=1 Tax=Streptomyces diastatochromogenes TaxID=42236 RepID=UPI0036B89F67
MLEPLSPKGKRPGRPAIWTRRRLSDGIRWRTRTGTPRRDVPERYRPWGRAYDLFRRWQRDGIWQRTSTELQARADAQDLITWDEPDDHGLGRSRRGLTTKLHLAAEQGQKPMSIVVTAGQRGDSPQFEPVLDKVRVPRMGPGRPRTRPARVRADKAYASRKTALTCADVESAAPSLTRPTRPTTERSDTTNLLSATKRHCWSPPSTNGCDRHATTSQAHTALTTAWPAVAARP